jgi:RimJ/RimL family protein N-acetyltransferase
MRAGRSVSLRSLSSPDLIDVAPWFEDPETQRWLGGPDLPELLMNLAENPPKDSWGKRVTGRYVWLAISAEGEPVGLLSVEAYADHSAQLDVIVAPSERGQGWAAAIVATGTTHRALSEVDTFYAEIEPENRASRRAFERVGFALESERTDQFGALRFVLRRRERGQATAR